jgi:hypothetical protein
MFTNYLSQKSEKYETEFFHFLFFQIRLWGRVDKIDRVRYNTFFLSLIKLILCRSKDAIV